MSRQNKLDAYPKALQQIKYVGQLIKEDKLLLMNVCCNNFRKNQRNKTKILSRKCNSLIKEARLKMTNTKLNKLKFAPKIKTGTTLSISRKKFHVDELGQELLLTTRQKTKIRNANNMLTDIKPQADFLALCEVH